MKQSSNLIGRVIEDREIGISNFKVLVGIYEDIEDFNPAILQKSGSTIIYILFWILKTHFLKKIRLFRGSEGLKS